MADLSRPSDAIALAASLRLNLQPVLAPSAAAARARAPAAASAPPGSAPGFGSSSSWVGSEHLRRRVVAHLPLQGRGLSVAAVEEERRAKVGRGPSLV